MTHRDPTRRNRNIGTAKQGHGANNRLVLPRRWQDCRWEWKRDRPHSVARRTVWGRSLPFVVEHTRADCVHACTVDDVVQILSMLPERHFKSYEYIDGIQGIVMRQPTRKEELLHPTWARLGYGVTIGPVTGPVVYLTAQRMPLPLVWSSRLDPEDQRELTRLQSVATSYRFDGRKHRMQFDIDGVRAVQLFHSLPHEIGHWADMFENVELPGAEEYDVWKSLWDQYFQRPDSEREEFAHRYADEFRARMQAEGRIPFSRTVDEDVLRSDGLRAEDFLVASSA